MTGGAYDTDRELASMHKHLALGEGSSVVDLGCSAGLYARSLAAAGMVVSAVDVSRAFLAEGARLARREGVDVRFVQADVVALPFADDAFDAAVSGGSLNEFDDAPRALREAARVLRDGAPLWLMYAARAETGPGRLLQGALRLAGLRFPEPPLVDTWARAAGLTPERHERRGPLVFALYRRGAGLPPLATSSPSPGWEGPTPRRNRRFNWERSACSPRR